MKKLWMLLIVLALLVTAVPMFASDVTFSGRMIWWGGYDFDSTATAANLARFRPTITAKIDDYNTLVSEFRMENYLVVKDTLADFWPGVRVYSAYVTTDVTGALGLNLPVTIKTQLGQWEPGFTDWNYVSESGWESYYDWPNGIADVGAFPNQFTGQVDLGFGPATLRIYSDFQGFMMFGVNGGYGPVVGWLTYQAPKGAFGEGILGVEAKYTAEFGDIKLGVPFMFRYKLGDASNPAFAAADGSVADWTTSLGVSGDYKIFHVAAGAEADSNSFPDNVVVDLSVMPVEMAKVYGHLYMDVGKDSGTTPGGDTSAFAAVDLGVSCKLGAANLMLGYVIGGDDKIAVPINGDTFNVANGLYMAVDVSY